MNLRFQIQPVRLKPLVVSLELRAARLEPLAVGLESQPVRLELRAVRLKLRTEGQESGAAWMEHWLHPRVQLELLFLLELWAGETGLAEAGQKASWWG